MEVNIQTVGWETLEDANYFRYFTSEALRRLPPSPAILDVGCGTALDPGYHPIRERALEFWGCDTDAESTDNESLDRFIGGDFVLADLPAGSFDFVMATYVLEHLEAPAPFFSKARVVLRQGGIFGFLTPNVRHPFCTCVRVVEKLYLKDFARRLYGETADGRLRVKEYPAYYRANSIHTISELARTADFKRADLSLVAGGWQYYFPWLLRFIPKTYDRLLVNLRSEGHLILVGFLQA